MRIELQKEGGVLLLADLRIGGTFLEEDKDVYQKLDERDSNGDIQCSCLRTGCIMHWYEDKRVHPIKVKVVRDEE